MVSFGLSKGARNLAVFLLGLIFLALVFEWFNHGSLLPLFVITRDNLWGWLEGTSPWLFFTAFIILPCLGLPISPFYLIAAGIPFRVYSIVSWPIQMAWALGFLILGKSVFEGRLGLGLFGGGLIIALALLTKITRDRYAVGFRSE